MLEVLRFSSGSDRAKPAAEGSMWTCRINNVYLKVRYILANIEAANITEAYPLVTA